VVRRAVGEALAEPVALADALVLALALGDVVAERDGVGTVALDCPLGSAETGMPNAVDGAQSALSGLAGCGPGFAGTVTFFLDVLLCVRAC
jgi:hypothetical protein